MNIFGFEIKRRRQPNRVGMAVGKTQGSGANQEAPTDHMDQNYRMFRKLYLDFPEVSSSVLTIVNAAFALPPYFVDGKKIIQTGLADSDSGSQPPQDPSQIEGAYPKMTQNVEDLPVVKPLKEDQDKEVMDPEQDQDAADLLQWWDECNIRWKLRETAMGMLMYGDIYNEHLKGSDRPGPQYGIDGLKPVAPFWIRPVTDRTNTVIRKYRQRYTGFSISQTEWSIRQMSMWRWNKLPGEIYGTSLVRSIYRALSDRREIGLAFKNAYRQFAHPITHFSPKDKDTVLEKTEIKSLADNMAEQVSSSVRENITGFGFPINFEILGAQRKIPDASHYIDDLKGSIMAGLLTPVVLLGQAGGATEATAKVQLAAYNWHIQTLDEYIADMFSNQVLPTVLEALPGKYGKRVKLVFPEPNNPVFNAPTMQGGPGASPPPPNQKPGSAKTAPPSTVGQPQPGKAQSTK